jgi:hypothetical protein
LHIATPDITFISEAHIEIQPMNTLQTVSIIFLVIMQLIIPVLFIYWMGFKTAKSKTNLILKIITVWTYFFFIYYTGRWDFISIYLRYFFALLLILASIKALLFFKRLPWFEKKSTWGWTKFSGEILFSGFFMLACLAVISGFTTEEKGIDIGFPLKEGFIGHGGGSTAINYHNEDSTAQQYALDIVKTNSLGLRASGFFPPDLNEYAIYGDTVYSPCDGKIVKAKDGLDNLPPGSEDKVNLAGNHIILEYQNSLIVFAHLLKSSLLVTGGEFVKKGQPIARVGNSGHTSEPHLHIHAVKGTDTSKILRGNGVPIYFNGKFLVRNDRIGG